MNKQIIIEERYLTEQNEIYFKDRVIEIVPNNQCSYCSNYVGLNTKYGKFYCAIYPYGNSVLDCEDFMLN